MRKLTALGFVGILLVGSWTVITLAAHSIIDDELPPIQTESYKPSAESQDCFTPEGRWKVEQGIDHRAHFLEQMKLIEEQEAKGVKRG